jgi:MFS family permease
MRITDMLAGAFDRTIAYLPNVLAALLILVVGFVVAKILATVTRRLLEAVHLERRKTAHKLVEREGLLARIPKATGRFVYWVVALITIGVAIDALQLAWLSAGVARVLGYVPNVVAAGVVVLAGYVLGNFVDREAAERRNGVSPLWARFLRGGIFVVAGFMAVQQLGIATAIVTMAFSLLLGAMALAGALAFGLGNRELAARVTHEWYERRVAGHMPGEPHVMTPEEERIDPRH